MHPSPSMALHMSIRRMCSHFNLTRNRNTFSASSSGRWRAQRYVSSTSVSRLEGSSVKRDAAVNPSGTVPGPSPWKMLKHRIKMPGDLPGYHETPSLRTESGDIIWPAPKEQIESARDFILECVAAGKKTLIVPDKDADGLSSGVILQKTLLLLGLDPSLISVHLLQKGRNVHDESEREAMAAHDPAYIFVLDQGSQKSPAVIDKPHRALIIDHHHAAGDDDFPAGAAHVTAYHSPPVATTSLLTYHICRDLHEGVAAQCDWLCVVGTHGDLGNAIKWAPPFPDMRATFEKHSKKAFNEAVSLVNAPRRTAGYHVHGAWAALEAASSPRDLERVRSLRAARKEVNAEVERHASTRPYFSTDGRVAVVRIRSTAQVHNMIAMRWARSLQLDKLEMVMVANEGYIPGEVRFSCRGARFVRVRGGAPVNVMEVLEGIVAGAPDGAALRARLGDSFARGHKEASGGVVPSAEFDKLMDIMGVDRAGKTTELWPLDYNIIAATESTEQEVAAAKSTEQEAASTGNNSITN